LPSLISASRTLSFTISWPSVASRCHFFAMINGYESGVGAQVTWAQWLPVESPVAFAALVHTPLASHLTQSNGTLPATRWGELLTPF
jgi:hypothetical protein